MKGQCIRYQQTGEFHFLTFSSFRRQPYLSTVATMELFEDALERVRLRSLFAVAGYVVMPEHVHLLVNEPGRGLLSRAIQALKLSVSMRSRVRPFWQAHYYDFNVSSHREVCGEAALHPSQSGERGLVAKPEDWLWSSYRHYQTGMRGTVEIESEWTARERGWQLPEWMREQAARFPFPGPQRRGTGGTLNLIVRGMRPGSPATGQLTRQRKRDVGSANRRFGIAPTT